MTDTPTIDLERASFEDIERAAAAVLSPNVYGFYATGAGDERTLAENVSSWSRWWLQPRRLTGVDGASMTVDVLGKAAAHPIIVAPSAGHQMAHPDGEMATARAVASLGGVLILSTGSNVPIEEVATVPGLDLWFQLYVFADETKTDALVERAISAGARALVITVDVPSMIDPHVRPKGGFEIPADLDWALHDGRSPILTTLDWAYVGRLRDRYDVPLVIKGVLHPDDAVRAVDEGVAAIIVSNHGGRVLDGSIPTAYALPEVAEAVDGRLEVYVDGGIRRGGDVLRSLALGARAALVGRPILWGLALDGEAGVRTVLGRLHRELAEDAVFSGIADLRDVPRDLVVAARF